jgi:hypothetical protein
LTEPAKKFEFDLKLNEPLETIPWNRLFREPTQQKYRILPDGFLLTKEIMNELKYSLFKEEASKGGSYLERHRSKKDGENVAYLGNKNGKVINMCLMDHHYFLQERMKITWSFFKQFYIFDNPDLNYDNYEEYKSLRYIKSKNTWVKETEERKFMMSGDYMRAIYHSLSQSGERLRDLEINAVLKATGISREALMTMKFSKYEAISNKYIKCLTIDGVKYYSFPPEFYLTEADIENIMRKPMIITTDPNVNLRVVESVASGDEVSDKVNFATFAQGDDLSHDQSPSDLKTDIPFETKNKLYQFYHFKDFTSIPKDYKLKEWSCRQKGKKVRQYALVKSAAPDV